MSGRRDPYPEVGAAIRQAIAASLDLGLVPGELKVLLAVIKLVSSYSRLSDRITVEQLAREAEVSKPTAQRALRRLRAAGILVEDEHGKGGLLPGGVAGRPSLIGFPAAPKGVTQDDTLSPIEKGVTQGDTLGEPKGVIQAPQRVSSSVTPTREGPREESVSPNGERSARGERSQPFLGAKQRATRANGASDVQGQERAGDEAEQWWLAVAKVVSEFGLDESEAALLREGCERNRDVGNLLTNWARDAADPRADLVRRLEQTRANGWRIPDDMERSGASGWGLEAVPPP